MIIFVYKVGSPLNSAAEIQQAKQWTLVGTVTPVEFTSFTGSVDNGNILLTWSTATEENNSGFMVERSTDGISYTESGFVKGNGTTTEKQNYSFTDKPGANGIYYYRLRQQDYDGKVNYSEVITMKLDIPADFNLAQNYPNPFNPSTTISFSVPVESFVTLSVYDLMGQEIVSLVKEVRQAGNYEINFDAAGLSSGTYIYKITAGNFIKSKKLMVLK
jgi:hypothetical protein